MELFDNYITNIQSLLAEQSVKRFAYNADNAWPIDVKSALILVRDSAYELGGSDYPSVGLTAVTENLDVESGVEVIGKDLSQISADTPFAKIVLLKIKSITADEQTLFNTVKELEYVKYKVNVRGFMARASAMNFREQVRVGKDAVKQGITFEKVGNALIKAYLQNPNVTSAKIIFVTDNSIDFDYLTSTAEKIREVTKTLNHILDNVIVDCKSCNLKPICDTVEGMRELHIKMAK